jgi:hypothetical protein
MESNAENGFINYYEHLAVDGRASDAELQVAFEKLVAVTQKRLNNPLAMNSARIIQNSIIPAIRVHLLAGPERRALYDQRLAAEKHRLAARDQLADDEGLDDALPRPFFFDPFNGYDTETPAFTLRAIARKLDEEWAQAIKWLKDDADQSHMFVGYLIQVAQRPQLAHRIRRIVEQVVPQQANGSGGMGINEGIERCISILDPDITRPGVEVRAANFDGRTLDMGTFISDQPARGDLLLGHHGWRGCAFGTVESRTEWLRFTANQARVPFSLLPDGTDEQIGVSQQTLPFVLDLTRLPRNAEYRAELVIRVENQPPPQEISLKVRVAVAPLPPRVSFTPPASRDHPLYLPPARHGEVIKVIVTPENAGDEALVPLAGRISTSAPDATASPLLFHHQKPITLVIDTRNRPYGKAFHVVFSVNYDPAQRALGPVELHLMGMILPTLWQSFMREKAFGARLGNGLLGCIVGGALGAGLGAWLSSHSGGWYLFLLIVPVGLFLLMRLLTRTAIVHLHRTGRTNLRLADVHPLAWGIPLIVSMLLMAVCVLSSLSGTVVTLSGMGGVIWGGLLCFLLDRARPTIK